MGDIETLKEGFAKRLREVINRSGETIKETARRCDMSRPALAKYLDPKNPTLPGAYNLSTLCQVLNVSADYLLFGKERL